MGLTRKGFVCGNVFYGEGAGGIVEDRAGDGARERRREAVCSFELLSLL